MPFRNKLLFLHNCITGMENNQLLNDRLPYGNAKLFLGIASIVLSPVIVGFILGVISVYLVDKDTQMLQSYPGNYSESAVSNHKQGKLWAWVGFIISVLVTLIIIVLFYKFGTIDPEKIKALSEQAKTK